MTKNKQVDDKTTNHRYNLRLRSALKSKTVSRNNNNVVTICDPPVNMEDGQYISPRSDKQSPESTESFERDGMSVKLSRRKRKKATDIKSILDLTDYNSIDDEDYDPSKSLEGEDEEDYDDFIDDDDIIEDDDIELINKTGILALLTRTLNKQLSEEIESSVEELECDDDDEENDPVQDSLHRKIVENIKKSKPTIKKLLKMDIPFTVQSELFEKIKVLNALSKYSEEYGNLKDTINQEIDRYMCSSLSKEDYQEYDDLEKEIMNSTSTAMPLKYRILSSEQSISNKKNIFEKFLTLNNLDVGDSNHGKLTEWIDWALGVPNIEKKLTVVNKNTARNEFVSKLRAKLDAHLYGMKPAKEEIMCIVNDYITNAGSSNKGLALVGSPGIGKTTIIRILAETLDIPFQQISLGGVKDASFLNGHSYTYEGAKPGAIVEALRRMKHKNGIIFFDEFDKIANTDKGAEVINVLLHITDPTQNSEFKDMYMPEITIDLSKIWFIYSMNDDKMINPVLRDRIPILKLNDYKETDKTNIFINHLLPKALSIYNYTSEDIEFDNETVVYLIRKIRKESGVRELKRSTEMIINKIHFLKSCKLKNNTLGSLDISFDLTSLSVDISKKVYITPNIIDKLLPNSNENKQYLSMYM